MRYAETDQMGVVYYANYFVWFEVGRTDLLRSEGWSYKDMEREGFSLPVVEAHCDYRQSAKYDDDIEIRTTGVLLSPVRVRFTYELVRPAEETVLAGGYTVHAVLDATGRPRRLPERISGLFQSEAEGLESSSQPRRVRFQADRGGPAKAGHYVNVNTALAVRGESPASPRDGRGAPPARRDDREYREYLREEQRSRRECIARRMQPDFHHGLLGSRRGRATKDPRKK